MPQFEQPKISEFDSKPYVSRMIDKTSISVIIPLFNKEEYILETLQALLQQTYGNFEIIIVDDGSSDNSIALVKKFKDERLKIIQQENQGVSVARNNGIRNAEGDWIAFLDADDWWDKNLLMEIVALMNVYPTCSVYAAGRSRVFNKVVERYQNEFLPEDGNSGMVDYIQVISKYLPPINSSNVIIKKSLIEERGMFKPGQKQHEDHDLWLRICHDHNIAFINKSLSYYRKAISNSASAKKYEHQDFIEYLKTLLLVKNKLSGKRRKWFLKYVNKFVLLSYLKNYAHYDQQQTSSLTQAIGKVVQLPYFLVIKGVNLIPNKNLYNILKKLR